MEEVSTEELLWAAEEMLHYVENIPTAATPVTTMTSLPERQLVAERLHVLLREQRNRLRVLVEDKIVDPLKQKLPAVLSPAATPVREDMPTIMELQKAGLTLPIIQVLFFCAPFFYKKNVRLSLTLDYRNVILP